HRARFSWSGIVAPIIGFGVFIGLWYLMHYWALEALFDKPSFLITEPHRVVQDSYLEAIPREQMLRGLGWTAFVALTGLCISILLGMLLAVVMAQATWVERSFWPYLIAAQAVPILAIVPIIGVIFGFGFSSRILVCVIISIFPIVSNTLFGLLSAERSQHDLFTLHDASRRTRLRKLQLPAALPAIFTGFRIAAGLSVIGAVVGELFFRRGSKGIGILMDQYRSRNLYALTYGALVLSSLLGIAVFIFFGWLGHAVVGRWHESTRKSIG
ncbi:MAG TPA: ABC transporter permease, partial [Ilumatobacteraceae bacterium]|nr:ABC transporter permease [Ilumatobacteraceae bacterium]